MSPSTFCRSASFGFLTRASSSKNPSVPPRGLDPRAQNSGPAADPFRLCLSPPTFCGNQYYQTTGTDMQGSQPGLWLRIYGLAKG
ncbi:rCG45421 [Rattus norvegicus]|uniref:RCG45421 n=1 Tax=Rattus norvegicus TaxID=10116 RepID=A6JTA9_RAT|nr:rCG45421 [Rattus norvegicus]